MSQLVLNPMPAALYNAVQEGFRRIAEGHGLELVEPDQSMQNADVLKLRGEDGISGYYLVIRLNVEPEELEPWR